MSLLEQDTTKKGRVDKKVRQIEFDAGNNDSRDYKVETIWDSAVYAKESKDYLPGLYYLVSLERYPEKENTRELGLAVQHFRKLISLFHKNYFDKPTATSEAIDTAAPMAKPIIKPTTIKQKWARPVNSTNKRAKNWVVFDFYRVFGQIQITFTLNIFSRIPRGCTWFPAGRFIKYFYLSTFQVSCLAWLPWPFKPQS